MTKIVISSLILFVSVLSAQRLTIKKPKNNSNIVPEDVIDIEWTYYRVDGKIKISYSRTGKWPWVEIDEVGVVEKSYTWFVPSTINASNDDGQISLRISSEESSKAQDEIRLRLPNYSKKVATNTVRPRSTKEKNAYDQAFYNKMYRGRREDDIEVYITKVDNIRYGPSTSYGIAKKTRYGQRLEYIAKVNNWFVVRTFDGNVGFTHQSNGAVVFKGAYPGQRTASSSSYSSSSSSSDDTWLYCCLLLLAILIDYGET